MTVIMTMKTVFELRFVNVYSQIKQIMHNVYSQLHVGKHLNNLI